MSTEEFPARTRHRRRLSVSAAVAVLLTAGGGAYWASAVGGGPAGSGGDAPPPRLVLDRAPGEGGETGGVAAGEPAGPIEYEASGGLPRGPRTAAVHRPAAQVQRSEVAALARALHVPGSPDERDGRWSVAASGGQSQLTVGEDGDWSYSRVGGVSEGQPPSETEAVRAVRPVLRALGTDSAEPEASGTASPLRQVEAAPEVAGAPTRDWETTFSVDGDGDVVRARGRLTNLVRGAEYPVLGAAQTLEQLNEHGAAQGAPGQTAQVKKAEFGLMTHYSRGEPVLVPSWTYETGAGRPVSYPAVAPEHMRWTGGEQPERRAAGQAVDSYRAEGRSLKLTFWAGVCDDYTASAAESETSVEVRVRAVRPDEQRMCVKMAKRQTVRAELDEPLGDRAVVDGRTGKPLPRR